MESVELEKDELLKWKNELELEKSELEIRLKTNQEEIERLRIRYKLSETVSWNYANINPKTAQRLGELSSIYFNDKSNKEAEFEKTAVEIRAKINEKKALLEAIDRWLKN